MRNDNGWQYNAIPDSKIRVEMEVRKGGRKKKQRIATDLHQIFQNTLFNTTLFEIDSRCFSYILYDLLVYAALFFWNILSAFALFPCRFFSVIRGEVLTTLVFDMLSNVLCAEPDTFRMIFLC